MDLSGLLPAIETALGGERLIARLRDAPHTVVGVPSGGKACFVAVLAEQTQAPLLAVTSRPDRAFALAEELASWLGATGTELDAEEHGEGSSSMPQPSGWGGGSQPIARVLLFPRRDTLPYERLTPDWAAVRERLRILSRLAGNGHIDAPRVIVTSVQALSQTTLSPDDMRAARETVVAGGRLAPEPFLRRLTQRGYRFEPLVDLPGQAARRGGIIDVFPPESLAPFRIELLGDRVESIRAFDAATQRTVALVESAVIGPAQEMLLPQPGARDLLGRLTLKDREHERYREELAMIAAGESSPDDAFYLPFLASSTLLDYLSPHSLLVISEMDEVAAAQEEHDRQTEEVRDGMIAERELPDGMPLPHLPWRALRERLEKRTPRVELSRWLATGDSDVKDRPRRTGEGERSPSPMPQALAGGGAPQVSEAGRTADTLRLPCAAVPAYGGRLPDAVRDIKEARRRGETVVVISQQAARLTEVFAEQDVVVAPSEVVTEPPPAGSLSLVHGSLRQGWRLSGEGAVSDGQAIRLLTDAELFGFVKQWRPTRPAAAKRGLFLSELAPGDLVVHIEHGIARFAGLTRLEQDGHEREYMELKYLEGDRLFVPTDQLDRVSRYVGPSEQAPHLTRLGSQEWPRAKERVRRAVTELAQELLELYASRQVLHGHAFSQDAPWQRELEASFPYVETPDQVAVIQEVKSDMEAQRPMDRLVVGDVGYGKTEVAIRASFKALMDGMQVAMLVPTTVLAQQHFQTFRERLAGFPVRVEMLSRFRSKQEQRDVAAELEQGGVDIVIGTHRLLQRDVSFKDLGLVIIDEEQRFGVSHKERLKRMRQEVDVLTLSATPIPRTLHMSLAGIRDMSTMDTPPEERLPIKTYVMEYDERLVREAVLRELERGGQVYFVHNRVHNIERIARRLAELVPEAKMAVAHGQMPEDQLARVMAEFQQGEIDVLVCTTIIESGIDIANVNTIIMNQADKLGLAQLYQLRGRVGRGVNRAYAYLLYDRRHSLTEPAQKRLQTIFEATELGAGFQIALRDLEIRGAGNLLGAEQSGYIGAVGFDLYSRLLGDAVERLKALQRGEKPPPPPPAPLTLDLPLDAYIPDSYVEDGGVRLALYQRMADVQRPDEVDEIAREMKDRFGDIPEPVSMLLYVVRLKTLGRLARVHSILTEDGEIVIRMMPGVAFPQEDLRRASPPDTWLGPSSMRLSRVKMGKRWQDILLTVVESIVRPDPQQVG